MPAFGPAPTRRAALAALAALGALAARPAAALTPAEAEGFVRDLAAEMIAITSGSTGDDRARAFLGLFKRVAALPQIARFTVGQAWRRMTEAQQAAYVEAFAVYASRAYARGVGDYKGQTLAVVGSADAGQRGVLVNSLLKAPGQQDARVDWLVSDRGGRPQVVDVVAEGVSLSISQREEFAAMLEKRGGDIDRFIADLAG